MEIRHLSKDGWNPRKVQQLCDTSCKNNPRHRWCTGQSGNVLHSQYRYCFTKSPQLHLDKIRKEHPTHLGWHDTSQAERIAAVSHPIHAWYGTQTEDFDGIRNLDYEQNIRGVSMYVLLLVPFALPVVGLPIRMREKNVSLELA